jgi:uncharacterized protein (DUF4415 family)
MIACKWPDKQDKSQGSGYPTRINALLRAYMEERKNA